MERLESLDECGAEDHFTITACFKKDCTSNNDGVCLAKLYRERKTPKSDPYKVERQKVKVIFDQLSELIKMLEMVNFKSKTSANEKVVELLYELENVKRELRLLIE